MSVRIGFVLLTHNKPQQALRLVRKLNSMFDDPPIAWHHDFTQCNLSENSFLKNIYFVRPHLHTGWGQFSIVDAGMAALKLLFQSESPPDWFCLLSGADYPIKTAEKIVYDLSSSPYDAHIRHERIRFNRYEREWQELCYRRYCNLRFHIPLTHRTIRLSHPLITRPFLPFSDKLACFAGEHWFSANRLAANYLIEFYRTKQALANHYRRQDDYRLSTSESYYQTVLCNAPHLKISENHWRYIDWSQGGPHPKHPKTLLMEDLPKLHASPAHFARKFDADVDDKVLDALDAVT